MKLLQVLGTGCAKCRELAEAVDETARSMNLEYDLEKVTDIQKIMEFGVMTTPALAVDGAVKIAGKMPSAAEIRRILES